MLFLQRQRRRLAVRRTVGWRHVVVLRGLTLSPRPLLFRQCRRNLPRTGNPLLHTNLGWRGWWWPLLNAHLGRPLFDGHLRRSLFDRHLWRSLLDGHLWWSLLDGHLWWSLLDGHLWWSLLHTQGRVQFSLLSRIVANRTRLARRATVVVTLAWTVLYRDKSGWSRCPL